MRSPVLFLVFNRPELTERVFQAIRDARPSRLYVAADGPRPWRHGEKDRCDQVRHVATSVDWPCRVETLFRDTNLGCKLAVSSAITWFFYREAEGIVLEDDCLPSQDFFRYCDELLERYRENEQVMCISGDNFISDQWRPESSYYFSRYAHIWGWATWARAWRQYRVEVAQPGEAPIDAVLSTALSDSPRARRYWTSVMQKVADGRVDTWDYQWSYTLFRNGGLSCMPQVNLISNIGFGPEATHTTDSRNSAANLRPADLPSKLVHPTHVQRSAFADDWTESNVFGLGVAAQMRRILHAARHRGRAAWHRMFSPWPGQKGV